MSISRNSCFKLKIKQVLQRAELSFSLFSTCIVRRVQLLSLLQYLGQLVLYRTQSTEIERSHACPCPSDPILDKTSLINATGC
jgi:hypothetical protein